MVKKSFSVFHKKSTLNTGLIIWVHYNQSACILKNEEGCRNFYGECQGLRRHRINGIMKLFRRFKLAEDYYYKGMISKAKLLLKDLLIIIPDHKDALSLMGFIYLHTNDHINATKHYKRAVEFYPNNDVFYSSIGNAFDSLKRYDEAINAYNKSIEISQHDAITHFNRGLTFEKIDQIFKACSDYTTACSLGDTSACYKMDGTCFGIKKHVDIIKTAYSKYKMAKLLYKKGDLKGSISNFSDAIKINKNYYEAYHERANSYIDLKDYQKAILDLNVAIKGAPSKRDNYELRGYTYMEIEKYQLAIQDYNTALKIDPFSNVSYYNRGISRGILGERKGACNDWKKACDLNYKRSCRRYRNLCKNYR